MANLPLAHTAGRPTVPSTFFRQLLNDESACASYLFGCKTHSKLAVVDPHIDLVDDYIAMAEAQGAPIVAIFETHVQADHVSGLPDLAQRTDAVAYLPEGAVGGRVLRFTETGMVALVDAEVPRSERHAFTLHFQGRVIGGEVTCLGQEERTCRLQFAALTAADRARLEPLIEEDA